MRARLGALPLLLVAALSCSEDPPASVPDVAPDTQVADAAASDASDSSAPADALVDAAPSDVAPPIADAGADSNDVAAAAPPAAEDVPDVSPDVAADVVQPSDVKADSDGDAADVAPPDPNAGVLATDPIGGGLCMSVNGYSKERRTIAVERLLEAGVRVVRSEIKWAGYEPQKGVLVDAAIDDQVLPYHEAGIEVIAVLAYGTPWASSHPNADAFYPPDDPADFANYVTNAVTHLGPAVRRYEVWNEPNAGYRFWKPKTKGDPVAFGTLLKAAVVAGRAACPDCEFAFGAPFFHTMIIDGAIPFLEQTYAAHPDLSDYYDAMGFHPYPFYPPQAAPEGPPEDFEWSFAEMTAGVRAVMAAHGAGDRPLWTTEFGWPIVWAVDQDRQAAYLVRGTLHLLALGAGPACWYTLFDGPKPEELPPEGAFGLLTNGNEADGVPQPKPSFRALVQLGTRFAAMRLTRDLRAAGLVPDGVHGFELTADDGERWWAVWTHPEPGPLAVPLPAAPIEARDQVGEDASGEVSGSTLQAGFRPIFVRLP